jgi:hypothetical protein
MRHRRRAAIAAMLAGALSLSTPIASARTLGPSPLARERGTNSGSGRNIFGPHPASLCRPLATSHIPFQLQGLAEGPYPGRYEEHGEIVLGRQDGTTTDGFSVPTTAGPILRWRSHVTIVSGDTTISGTIRLDPSMRSTSFGICNSFVDVAAVAPAEGWSFTGFDVSFDARVRFRGTIAGPDGTARVTTVGHPQFGVGRVVPTACPIPPPSGCSGESGYAGGGVWFS